MAGEFGDSPGKQTVRKDWNTPILRHLNQKYGIRYRYMGLPGENLLDIILWADMIDEVTAFEFATSDRSSINKLSLGLELLSIPYTVYAGPMESVILLGKDNDGQSYSQRKLMTLYNLDFCNQIDSKVQTPREGRQAYRYEAIKKILADQRRCFEIDRKPVLFALLLTVKNQVESKSLTNLLRKQPLYQTQVYVDACREIDPIPADITLRGTHTWALKAFVYNMLQQYFVAPSVRAFHFPVVKYIGRTDGSPMLHFMVLCEFDGTHEAIHDPMPEEFLSVATCARATADGMIWEPEPSEPTGHGTQPSSLQWFLDFRPKTMPSLV